MTGGSRSTEGLRIRMARGRPSWWVILAVSLALMALLVAIAGGSPRRTPGSHALSATSGPAGHPSHPDTRDAPKPVVPTTTSTTLSRVPPAADPVTEARSSGGALTSNHFAHSATPAAIPPTTTTTTMQSAPSVPTTTTTPLPSVAQPADRAQWQGYLDPPVQTSTGFGFTGTGAMTVSVVWSGSTYLTMSVSCANGTQDVGGTSAMAATLPDASGNCRATVAEPSTESTALTFTISIGPAGG